MLFTQTLRRRLAVLSFRLPRRRFLQLSPRKPVPLAAQFPPLPAPLIIFGVGGRPPTSSSPKPAPAATNAPPAPATFVPEFQTNMEVVNATGGSQPLNPAYFATRETAQYIADKFGTG